MRRFLVTASVVPSSPILVTLMKKALSSYLTWVLTWATRGNIPEDGILQNQQRTARFLSSNNLCTWLWPVRPKLVMLYNEKRWRRRSVKLPWEKCEHSATGWWNILCGISSGRCKLSNWSGVPQRRAGSMTLASRHANCNKPKEVSIHYPALSIKPVCTEMPSSSSSSMVTDAGFPDGDEALASSVIRN
jgi:hypothetical protein